ncbi:5-formyltetrahydrofolate cyclo-ligase [Fibrella sp. HMF5405]|uniref:5-formyltetrahydrofolate cyclo-ligase n=2 Tax=Fibrella forsythiae TaxID=2817061 RepID=A0ABS3JIY5_9BACT|nr:5-formyltetrahydrofolate cyclo-ligase [Fibrella forsythiae]
MTKRKALVATEHLLYSQQILAQFFSDTLILSCLAKHNTVVHTYLPILRNNEVDTWPIIQQLWRDFPSLRIWSSITDSKSHTLRHFQLTADTALTETKWGIPEPSGAVEFVVGQPDLVIVPLLAFDNAGNRVGYGGGYYDRFLAEAGPDCLKIGLSFFDPVEHITGIEETDIRLDTCITPEAVFSFR